VHPRWLPRASPTMGMIVGYVWEHVWSMPSKFGAQIWPVAQVSTWSCMVAKGRSGVQSVSLCRAPAPAPPCLPDHRCVGRICLRTCCEYALQVWGSNSACSPSDTMVVFGMIVHRRRWLDYRDSAHTSEPQCVSDHDNHNTLCSFMHFKDAL
jgi:hypothetical protein